MEKKEIQAERMQRYFLDSTKNIIKSEGIQALTVRSIADNAGYSFGTIYNYYKDVKDLTYQSALEFMNECKEYVFSSQNTGHCDERIKFKAFKYVEYFVQYTGIYQLLFITGKNDVGNFSDFSKSLLQMNFSIFESEFIELFGDNHERLLEMFIILINGNLLFYINRHYPEQYMQLRENLIIQIDEFLKINTQK